MCFEVDSAEIPIALVTVCACKGQALLHSTGRIPLLAPRSLSTISPTLVYSQNPNTHVPPRFPHRKPFNHMSLLASFPLEFRLLSSFDLEGISHFRFPPPPPTLRISRDRSANHLTFLAWVCCVWCCCCACPLCAVMVANILKSHNTAIKVLRQTRPGVQSSVR